MVATSEDGGPERTIGRAEDEMGHSSFMNVDHLFHASVAAS